MLQAHGLKVGAGTIICATGSTKNADKQHDLKMRQNRKGKQPFFGTKLRISVDAPGGLGAAPSSRLPT